MTTASHRLTGSPVLVRALRRRIARCNTSYGIAKAAGDQTLCQRLVHRCGLLTAEYRVAMAALEETPEWRDCSVIV